MFENDNKIVDNILIKDNEIIIKYKTDVNKVEGKTILEFDDIHMVDFNTLISKLKFQKDYNKEKEFLC